MPLGDPRNVFFYPILTLMIYSYNLRPLWCWDSGIQTDDLCWASKLWCFLSRQSKASSRYSSTEPKRRRPYALYTGKVLLTFSMLGNFSWCLSSADIFKNKTFSNTVKPVLNSHWNRWPKIGFQDLLLLNAGQYLLLYNLCWGWQRVFLNS